MRNFSFYIDIDDIYDKYNKNHFKTPVEQKQDKKQENDPMETTNVKLPP